MKNNYLSFLKKNFTLLTWGVIYFLSGLISLKFNDPDSTITIVWFPAGVAVAAFLSVQWREYPVLIIIFTLVTTFLDEAWQSFSIFLLTFLFSFLALLANILIAWTVRRFSRQHDDLHTILMWICATFLFSALDSLIFAGGYAFYTGQPIMKIIWNGFGADVTGIFYATTVVMGFVSRRGHNLTFSWFNCFTGVALLLMIGVATFFIFEYDATSLKAKGAALYFGLTCLPIVLILILSLVWGNRGGSIGLIILGGIVIYFTDLQKGPFFLESLSLTESLLLALSYLSLTALLIVFVRVLMCSTSSFNPDDGRITGYGFLYRLEPDTEIFTWENDLSLLQELSSPHEYKTIEQVLSHVHPLDRVKLRNHWLTQDQNLQGSIIFRIRTKDNKWMTLVDTCSNTIVLAGTRFIIGNWQRSHYDLNL